MFRRLSTVNRVLNYNIIRSAGGFSKVASVIPNFTAPVYRRECELTRLDNEITVSTVESGSHMNSVSLYIKTGSRYETEENNGANFLLQHAGFFTKSKNEGVTISQAFERIGAIVNVDASREHVGYNLLVKQENLDRALNILAEMITNLSSISNEEVNSVRDLVMNEKKHLEKDLDFRACDHLHSIAYQASSLALTRQGTFENLKNLSAADLQKVAKQYYGSVNMTIGAAGNFQAQSFISSLEKNFQVPKGEAALNKPNIVFGSAVHERDDRTDDAHITIGYAGIARGSSDYYTLQAIRHMVGDYSKYNGGSNNHSQNLAELVATEKVVDSYHTFNHSYADTGLFGVSLRTHGKNLDDAVCYTVSEFTRIANSSRPSEISRAKNALRNEVLFERDGIDSLSKVLARNAFYGTEIRSFSHIIDKINQITPDSLRELAQNHFMDAEPVIVGIGSTRKLPDYNQIRGWTHWWRM